MEITDVVSIDTYGKNKVISFFAKNYKYREICFLLDLKNNKEYNLYIIYRWNPK